MLVFRFNNYQGSIYFNSTNRLSGTLYEYLNGVTDYFHLRSINDTLIDRNLALEQQLAALEARLISLTQDTAAVKEWEHTALANYTKIEARVINNSLNLTDNYITINRGYTDSVYAEMGVVSGMGLVGVVELTAPHYALVISLLNSKSNISCKIKGRNYFGYLHWDGKDSRYTYLHDLPRHAVCYEGDTIVTSGYSSIFPEGIMVGRVEEINASNDGFSYVLKVRLFTDFGRLNDVRVIARRGFEEQQELEQKIEETR